MIGALFWEDPKGDPTGVDDFLFFFGKFNFSSVNTDTIFPEIKAPNPLMISPP